MAVVTICSDFGAIKNNISHCFHCFPNFLPWVMGPDAMILVFWMLSFKPTFSLLLKGYVLNECAAPLSSHRSNHMPLEAEIQAKKTRQAGIRSGWEARLRSPEMASLRKDLEGWRCRHLEGHAHPLLALGLWLSHLRNVRCLQGVEGRPKRERIYVHIQLVHLTGQQTLTEHWKQLYSKKRRRNKEGVTVACHEALCWAWGARQWACSMAAFRWGQGHVKLRYGNSNSKGEPPLGREMVLTREGTEQPHRQTKRSISWAGGSHTGVSICKNSLSCALQMCTFYCLCGTSIEKERKGKHFLKGKRGLKEIHG